MNSEDAFEGASRRCSKGQSWRSGRRRLGNGEPGFRNGGKEKLWIRRGKLNNLSSEWTKGKKKEKRVKKSGIFRRKIVIRKKYKVLILKRKNETKGGCSKLLKCNKVLIINDVFIILTKLAYA